VAPHRLPRGVTEQRLGGILAPARGFGIIAGFDLERCPSEQCGQLRVIDREPGQPINIGATRDFRIAGAVQVRR